MTRLAVAVLLTATAGVASLVTHHHHSSRRLVLVQSDAPGPVIPPRVRARASRGERRLPLPVNAARPKSEGVPRSGLAPVGRPAGNGTLNWDALAACESGGDWQANTGNGFYGGVQFDLSTWRSVGGRGLPSQASKAEQIARATVLYNERGREPWPVCGWRLVA